MILLAIDPQVVIWSGVVFTGVILVLVLILQFAAQKLVKQGQVSITINGERTISVPAGGTLLSALSNEKLFLPSACGGGGTCAMCKCQVMSGGGDILQTETGHLNRKMQQEHYRLACQVKVKENMNIEIPEEIFGIKKWECEVVSNDNVATFIKEFVVKLPEGESLHFESGGYIQIDVPVVSVDFSKDLYKIDDEYRGDYDKFKIWDLKMVNPEPQFRAYSMANHPAEGNMVKLNIRIATPPWDRATNSWMKVNPGVCSSYIFSRKPGDKVTISGPYGEFFIKNTKREMMYVGGGAGMAPLRSHIFHMFHTMKMTDRKVSFWYGGRSKKELFYVDEFRAIEREFPNFKFYVVLSEPEATDNWKVKDGLEGEGDGFTGFVHQSLIDNYLSKHQDPEDIEFYFCGPPMMNKAVLKMVEDLGVPEENVAFDDFGG